MSVFKLLSEDESLELANNLLKKTSPEITKTLNNIFQELVEAQTHFPVVKLLFSDYRVHTNIDYHKFIPKIISENNLNTIELIFQHPYVNPNMYLNSTDISPFVYAVVNNSLKIVKMLLKNNRVNPGGYENTALRKACKCGHTEIVKLLLEDTRVNPEDYYNDAINSATDNNHIEIVKLLIPRVDISKINSDIVVDLIRKLEKKAPIIQKSEEKINNFPGPIGGDCIINVTDNCIIGTTSTVNNKTSPNKFITDFIASCPAKTPFEIYYVDNVLTIKYKV